MKSGFLCLGLDSDGAKLPKGQTQLSFNQALVEATQDLVAAYKLNSAFYESQGAEGWTAMKETIAFIHQKSPGTPVIWDTKRGDIANTSEQYAKAAFEELKADAITLNPYMGRDALAPFLNYKDKTCYILCRTSNPGAKDFQNDLYLKVAQKVADEWNENKNCGLVVGATYPEELKKVRLAAPDLPLLVPGVGAQGGELTKVLEYGRDAAGRGLLINVSRSIIFAPDARKEIELWLRQRSAR